MKFQGEGLEILKSFYDKSKLSAQNGKNPLNSSLSFEKSFMTDLLQGMINDGVKIKAIPILSKIVGYNPNSGKIVNCIMMAIIRPVPTSIKLSIKQRLSINTDHLVLILFEHNLLFSCLSVLL